MRRWYFDRRAGRCEQFEYGGCNGNKNNFETESECQQTCRSTDVEAPLESDICDAPRDHGNGDRRELKYFYNRETTTCEGFTYTGAGGNGNRFESQEQCERQCGEYRGEDICSQAVSIGPCDQWQEKYYYDAATRSCNAFNYGGCEGTGNRFASMEECQGVCITHEEPAPDSRGMWGLCVN